MRGKVRKKNTEQPKLFGIFFTIINRCQVVTYRLVHVEFLLHLFELFVAWYEFLRLLPGERNPLLDALDNFTLSHTHAISGMIRYEPRLFPTGVIPCVVAPDDALDLPPLQAVKEVIAVYSYLAHE